MHITPTIVPSGRGLAYVASLGAAALLFAGLQRRSDSFVIVAGARFLATLVQLITFLLVAGALQYAICSTNMPLIDAALQRADAALGFDWHAYTAWIARHPVLQRVLAWAYLSIFPQAVVLLTVHTMRGGRQHVELVWCVIASLLIVSACAALFPAAGYPGWIGEHHITVFQQARAGIVQEPDGIITFPSFHAVLGILLAYSARTAGPLFALSVPLNGLLLLATPAAGGHYLVDVIAGIFIAVLAIFIARRVAPAS